MYAESIQIGGYEHERANVDHVQLRLRCCGQWNASSYLKFEDKFPPSCYVPRNKNFLLDGKPIEEEKVLRQEGCGSQIKQLLTEYLYYVILCSALCGILQFLMFTISIFEMCVPSLF